ncbi:MAG: secondary thiamine-phosphate synthase enzyme YjbQ [Candidatus Bathyarchaeota archaeon]|nr:secondary thiamine-phosphate synthase enzyme YjbQ [Candidatus Bathyarchaeota archaeon]
MKIFSGSIEIRSGSRKQIANITDRLDELITGSGIQNGVLTGLVKHSTTFLIISGIEESLKDLLNLLENIINEGKLNKTSARTNMESVILHSHLQNLIAGASISVPLMNGKLDLGEGQSIYFVELAGPRDREISVTIIGE